MLEKLKPYSLFIAIGFVALYLIGRYLYAQPRVVNGEAAPNIVATTLSGQPFDLSSLRGRYVLLDFWGSWCGPCIEEAPKLKMLNDKYAAQKFADAQGFTMVSIGIEKERSRWENAIQSLGLNWPNHISDFQYLDSPMAQQYGVRVIPTKILLNTEGVIIGVNQSVEEIDAFLAGKKR